MAGIALALPSLLKTTEFDTVHILKSLFFIPAEHPKIENMAWPLLVQGWTLNFEMFFYLVFGILLLVSRRLTRLVLLCSLLGGLIVAGAMLQPDGPMGQSYTSPLFLEFLFGAVIGHAYVSGHLRSRNTAQICLVLSLGFFALGVFHPVWGHERAVTWGIPSALLLIAALGLETGKPGHPILMALGDASYSTYLNHTFTLGVIGVLWAKLGNGSVQFDAFMFFVALVASAVVGILSYRLIERPMTSWLKA